MATRRWIGGAATLPHKYTLTITAATDAYVYGITLGGIQATYTASVGTDTTSTIASAVAAACAVAKSVYSELAISVAGAVITFQTADGAPFTLALVNGSHQTLTNTQTGTGPNFVDDADNWSGQTVPQAADTVIFENTDVDCLYALETHAADTFAELRVEQSFTGKLGLPTRNPNGFEEYRETYFECGATLCKIGRGGGSGSPRVKIDLQAVQSTVTVFDSGQSQDDYYAIILKGTHASNVLNVIKGQVDVAPLDTDVATFLTAVSTYRDTVQSDVSLRFGPGVTLTNGKFYGGVIELEVSTTTLIVQGADVTLWGGTHADIDIFADGTVNYVSSGNLTNLSIADGTFDASEAPEEFVVVNTIELFSGGRLLDPNGRINKSYSVDLNECRLEDVELVIGSGPTVTVST